MTTDNEEKLVASGRGKWSQAGVPHKGWRCVDVEDLGELGLTCEMCESQQIRYVHHMEHDRYSQALQVGCVCAGHMEENMFGARLRESAMKSRSGKRRRWLTRRWRTSARGRPWIRTDGYRVTIWPRDGGWAATVASADDTLVQHSRRIYPDQDGAKLAAFDQITRLLSENSS